MKPTAVELMASENSNAPSRESTTSGVSTAFLSERYWKNKNGVACTTPLEFYIAFILDQFSDLYRVKRRAFQNLIPTDKNIKSFFIVAGNILTDATYQNVILT